MTKLKQLPPLRQLRQYVEQQARPAHPHLSFSTRPINIPRTAAASRLSSRKISTLRSQRSTRSYATAAAAAAATGVPASHLLFGQPVHETHPHLLAPGELTPGITAIEYHERRAALCHSLPRDSAVILPSASVQYRSGAVFHGFRQESNFLYLTGFSEPESLVVLRRTGDEPGDYIFHLFCRPKDPRAEQWSGPWSGLDAARDVWNADAVGDIARAEPLLTNALRGVARIYTDAELARPPSDGGAPTRFSLLLRAAAPRGVAMSPLRSHVNNLRAIKSEAEVANMRRAGRDSGRALTEAMRRPWRYEKDLAAFLDYEYQRRGLDGSAYIPVVAGGRKATLIHYVQNSGAIDVDSNELVLVDAGGEYGTYITDITRTWPSGEGGRFSAPQRDLYEAVLRAQRSSVALCRASANLSLDQLNGITDAALRDQLRDLGFDLRGDDMARLFPHHVGHYVGLDVHDTPGYPRTVPLREGHCVTVEPGIYVPDEDRFPAHFRGLGIRIEDSICVGDDAPLVLTTEAVKEVADIEALRG